MHLYAYPVIFFIFDCKYGYGIVVKRSGYAEAFIYNIKHYKIRDRYLELRFMYLYVSL